MTDKAAEFKKQNAQESHAQMREVDGKKEYLDEETGEWVSKNELKKRTTLRKKATAAAQKPAKKVAGEKKEKPGAQAEEEIDPSKYTENRKHYLEHMREEGQNPYPHKFNRDMTIPQFKDKYEGKAIA